MKITISKTGVSCKLDEQLVKYSQNAVKADVEVTDDTWACLVKNVIWKNDSVVIEQVLGSEPTITVPWEVLSLEGKLLVGVCGYGDSGNIVRPTTWALVGNVVPGVLDGMPPERAADPTPSGYGSLVVDVANLKDAIAKSAGSTTGSSTVYKAGSGISISDGYIISAEVSRADLDGKADKTHTPRGNRRYGAI